MQSDYETDYDQQKFKDYNKQRQLLWTFLSIICISVCRLHSNLCFILAMFCSWSPWAIQVLTLPFSYNARQGGIRWRQQHRKFPFDCWTLAGVVVNACMQQELFLVLGLLLRKPEPRPGRRSHHPTGDAFQRTFTNSVRNISGFINVWDSQIKFYPTHSEDILN